MRQLIGNLKKYWVQVVIIALFLGLQAYADLSLPTYTQDIIDVGIQNKGIEHILPEKTTKDEYENAQIFMSKSEKSLWKSAYKKDGKLYVRTENSSEKLQKLDDKLLIPVVLTYQLGHTSVKDFKSMVKSSMEKSSDTRVKVMAGKIDGMSIDELEKFLKQDIKTFKAKDEKGNIKTYVDTRPILGKMISSGQMDDKAIAKAEKQMKKTVEAVGERTLKSMAITYAYNSHEAAGIDVDRVQKDYLWSAGIRMFMMALLMFLAAGVAAVIASRVGANIGRNLRREVFTNVMRFSSGEMDKFSTASLITRSTNDVQQVQNVTTMMLRMVMFAPIMGIWGIIKVAQTGANMGYIVALGVIFIMLFVLFIFAITMPKFKIMQDLVDGVNRVAREILTGLSVIRAFGREKESEARFETENEKLKKTQLFTTRVMSMMQPSMQLFMFALVIVVTWVSAHRIGDGELEVGAMTAFITYSMMIVMSFVLLTVMSIILPRAGVAAKRISEVIETESSIKESETPEHIEEPKGLVRFENVDFMYPDAEQKVLSDIDFVAKPGETTAIIGSTGSGKSSLINLIPRFFDVTGGRITIDGVDIRNLSLKELRSYIGLVPQKGILFSGTIESNIKFGNHDASDEEVSEAAEIAQAMEFINEKEEKFHSDIAQGGSNVSGGQKQRLAIARAIAKNPKILIFDDSFSALDMKTDKKVRKELSKKAKDATKIIIAQRVSTILNAEQILVLDEGKLVGKGTHKELMETCEVYKQIALSQLSNKELEEL